MDSKQNKVKKKSIPKRKPKVKDLSKTEKVEKCNEKPYECKTAKILVKF